jgi:Flp pilus assembly protein TadD
MSNSQPSIRNLNFWFIAGLTLTLSSALVVSTLPYLHQLRLWEAGQLVREGSAAHGAEAEADYRLAHKLDTENPQAALHFAVIETNTGRPEDAITTLQHAGMGREVEVARLRAEIEAGELQLAVSTADHLLVLAPSSSDIVLIASAYGLAGYPARAVALVPIVSSLETLQGVQRAASDELGLASVLAAQGLQTSASALLVKIPNSIPRSLLLAQIFISQNTPASLSSAVEYLKSGISLAPANSEVRVRLISVLKTLGRTDEAGQQQALLDRLLVGRP